MSKISIVSVNYKSEDWLELQLASIRKFSKEPHEVIYFDNSQSMPDIEGVKIVRSETNVRHGKGLDEAIKQASGEYVLVLDSDAHILTKGWEDACLAALEGKAMIGAEGDMLKPMRPCVMFLRKDVFLNEGHSFQPVFVDDVGGKMNIDVGVFYGMRLQHDGHKVDVLKYMHSPYENVWGDGYGLNGIPLFYHNWYGSRFREGYEEIDGRKATDMEEARRRLFEQALARVV